MPTIGQLLDTVAGRYPEWRYGQIIANAVRAVTGRTNCDPFYIDDGDLLEGLLALLDDDETDI